MSLLGKKITLKGVSQKGKNRITKFSSQWFVLAETDKVVFSQEEPGLWLFVSPIMNDQNHKSAGWIKVTDDPDFLIEL